MEYISKYKSPLGELLLTSDEKGLTGIWYNEQEFFEQNTDKENEEQETEYIKLTKKWLDIYFKGEEPKFDVPLHTNGTDFQNEVWDILKDIPYGKTMTYGEVAHIIAKKKGIKRMSAQAVGGALGRNNIPIMLPCHRVLGAKNKLVGYTGGLDKKIKLLKLEKILNKGERL